jgi:hypothetical protein
MLGFGAIGEFALGQGEPWTLKGRLARGGRQKGRGGTRLDTGPTPDPNPIVRVIAARPKVEGLSPDVVQVILMQKARREAIRRDDEEAIVALLMVG